MLTHLQQLASSPGVQVVTYVETSVQRGPQVNGWDTLSVTGKRVTVTLTTPGFDPEGVEPHDQP